MGIVTEEPLTYACIPCLEEILDVNLHVVRAIMGDKFSYDSANRDWERKKVFLHHDDVDDREHFHVITKITGFFGRSYFCQYCLVPFEKPYHHNCVKHCNV